MQKVLYACSNDGIRVTAGRYFTEASRVKDSEFSFVKGMLGVVDIIEEGEADSLIIQGRLNEIDDWLGMMNNGEKHRRVSSDGFYPAYGPADMFDIIKEACSQAGKPMPRICFGIVPEDFSKEQIAAAINKGLRVIDLNARTEDDHSAGIHQLENWIASGRKVEYGNDGR